MSINTQYIVLFKNPRDQIGPAILARQMYPSHPKKFMIKYTKATKRPYGCLFIDLKQNTPEEDRLKTDIFDSVPDNKLLTNYGGWQGGGVYKQRHPRSQSV